MHVGLRTIPSFLTEDDADLTWTSGVQVCDFPDKAPRFRDMVRKVDKTFCLGTPPDLNLARDDLTYAGHAIFFYGHEQTASEGDAFESCEGTVRYVCFNNLQDNARASYQRLSAQDASLTPEEICQQAKVDLNTTFPGDCSKVSGDNFWRQSEAVSKSSSTQRFLDLF